jgi:hypothetical protein
MPDKESIPRSLVNFTIGWLPAKALPRKELHLRGNYQKTP